MNRNFIKNTLIIAASIILLVFALNTTISREEPIVMRPLYSTNFDDDRKLMGAFHNVFVAKIIRQTGTENITPDLPGTQFEVEVIYNIKGNLEGTVIVNQQGGYRDGVLYVMENSGGLLEVGSTYLVAARYNETRGTYTMGSHPNAIEIITKNESLSDAQIRELAKQSERTRRLEQAYKNEILFDRDIKNNDTRNSYKSLQ